MTASEWLARKKKVLQKHDELKKAFKTLPESVLHKRKKRKLKQPPPKKQKRKKEKHVRKQESHSFSLPEVSKNEVPPLVFNTESLWLEEKKLMVSYFQILI